MYFVIAAVSHLPAAARVRALDAADIPQRLLQVPNARVPASAFSTLWLAVARELNDEFFGLGRRAMKTGSFALLCNALLSCENLGVVVKRMLRGFSVFLDDLGGDLCVDGKHAVIQLTNTIEAEADRRFAEETFLILVHRLACWLIGRRIPLRYVAFTHPRPSYASEYTLMFCDEVRFDAAATALCFDTSALSCAVVQTPQTVRPFLRSAPHSLLLKYQNKDSVSALIRRRLRAAVTAPERFPLFEEVAADLRTTETTLRRRLEAEGVTFQSIKDQLRNDLAIHLLCQSTTSLEEIASRLGFHDASAFHRAFKRWNGLQPGEYRRRQQGPAS